MLYARRFLTKTSVVSFMFCLLSLNSLNTMRFQKLVSACALLIIFAHVLFVNTRITTLRLRHGGPLESFEARESKFMSKPLAEVDVDNVTCAHGDAMKRRTAVEAIYEGMKLILHSVNHNSPSLRTPPKNMAAWAEFQDAENVTGWSHLSVNTPDEMSSVPENVKMYAAGFIEGYLTAPRIKEFFENSHALLNAEPAFNKSFPTIRRYFTNGINKIAAVFNQRHPLSAKLPEELWSRHASLQLLQLWGMKDGYDAYRVSHNHFPQLSVENLFLMNADGQINSLIEALSPDLLQRNVPDASQILDSQLTKERLINIETHGRCSALVRLTANNSEIFLGHTTWEPYSEMTRIFKYYNFPLKGVSANKIAFSSYPGCISSTDEFYMVDSGLSLIETTLNIFDKSIFQQMDNAQAQVPDFMKIMTCNRVSKSASDWISNFRQLGSYRNLSSYGSEWLVVDYNKFKPGRIIQPRTFFVLDQVPGKTHVEDLSRFLQDNRYFSSENRAWFQDIRTFDGEEREETRGLLSKTQNPRAMLFQKTAPYVETLSDMRRIMQLNPNNNTTPQEDKGLAAVSARFDLSEQTDASGGTDSKITSKRLFTEFMSQAISGPEHSNNNPFSFSKFIKEHHQNIKHDGLPDVWNFDWELITPTGLKKVDDVA